MSTWRDWEDGSCHATPGLYNVWITVWGTVKAEIPKEQDIDEWITRNFEGWEDTDVDDVKTIGSIEEDGKEYQVIEIKLSGSMWVETRDPYGDYSDVYECAEEWASGLTDCGGEVIGWDYEMNDVDEIEDDDHDDRRYEEEDW